MNIKIKGLDSTVRTPDLELNKSNFQRYKDEKQDPNKTDSLPSYVSEEALKEDIGFLSKDSIKTIAPKAKSKNWSYENFPFY